MSAVRFRVVLCCLFALLLTAVPALVMADGDGDTDAVARDEALALKTTLKAALAALGAPPAEYEQAKEDYDLPTEMGVDKKTKTFWLSQTDADYEFTAGMSGEKMAQEYQKKMAAAQTKGDIAEIQKLSMELQQKMGQAMGTEMTKIKVQISLNRDPYQTIDPEGVLWEAPGAIALKTGVEGDNIEAMLVFDPKGLADTTKISKITLNDTVRAPARTKTAVRSIVIELKGPEAAVTEWAQHCDKGKMLALIHD